MQQIEIISRRRCASATLGKGAESERAAAHRAIARARFSGRRAPAPDRRRRLKNRREIPPNRIPRPRAPPPPLAAQRACLPPAARRFWAAAADNEIFNANAVHQDIPICGTWCALASITVLLSPLLFAPLEAVFKSALNGCNTAVLPPRMRLALHLPPASHWGALRHAVPSQFPMSPFLPPLQTTFFLRSPIPTISFTALLRPSETFRRPSMIVL